MVEPRRKVANGSTERLRLDDEPVTVLLPDGEPLLHLLRRAPDSERIWLAVAAAGVDLAATMAAAGRPIRYQYVPRDWPLDSYQTVFATEPGSAEMPSAARPFTDGDRHPAGQQRRGDRPDHAAHRRVVAGGGRAAVHRALSGFRRPRLPLANATHRGGGHVIAIGTTVVRALETVTDRAGTVHPGEGWTDLVVTPPGPRRRAAPSTAC